MNTLVRFRDILESHPSAHYGVLKDDGEIICFCCGGNVEPDDYELLEEDIPWSYLDEITKNNL